MEASRVLKSLNRDPTLGKGRIPWKRRTITAGEESCLVTKNNVGGGVIADGSWFVWNEERKEWERR